MDTKAVVNTLMMLFTVIDYSDAEYSIGRSLTALQSPGAPRNFADFTESLRTIGVSQLVLFSDWVAALLLVCAGHI